MAASLRTSSKVPGLRVKIHPVCMDFKYDSTYGPFDGEVESTATCW